MIDIKVVKSALDKLLEGLDDPGEFYGTIPCENGWFSEPDRKDACRLLMDQIFDNVELDTDERIALEEYFLQEDGIAEHILLSWEATTEWENQLNYLRNCSAEEVLEELEALNNVKKFKMAN